MTKLRNAILALTASLLSTGALAQAASFVQDSVPVVVAEELFGVGAVVELEFEDFVDESTPFVPKAKLILATGDLNAGTEFSVTFSFKNATLAEAVVNKHFMWGTWGPQSQDRGGADCDTTTNVRDPDNNNNIIDVNDGKLKFCPNSDEIDFERQNGRKKDPSVTFDITIVGAEDPQNAGTFNQDITGQMAPMCVPTDADQTPMTPDVTVCTGETRKIVLILPDVLATGLVARNAMGTDGTSVKVRIDIEQPKMGSGDSQVSESIESQNTCAGKGDSTNTMEQVDCPVVYAHKVITGIDNMGGSGTISLDPDHGRMQLAPAGPVKLSTVQIKTAFGGGGVWNAEGEVITDKFEDAMAGTLAISVASDKFNEGDIVYIDANKNKTADTGEQFVISNGVATDSVGLSTDAVDVYYLPSGEHALTHRSKFTISARTEFSKATNKNRSAKPVTATLSLAGISTDGVKAYAIAPVSSTDRANVRVTCESSLPAGCRVFFECRDQAGMSTFGEGGEAVGPNMTSIWQQEGIQDALGIDSWEGRLSCNVLSTAPVSVQVLTRSVGVLVNNTSVND